MTKREITLVAFGAVAAALGAVAALLAYGVFVSPSAEVPEVPEVRTVAEIDPEIAVVEADQAYLEVEMSKVRLFRDTELTCYDAIQNSLSLENFGKDAVLPPCNGLLQEWEELHDQLNVLHRERVQAQMRERE